MEKENLIIPVSIQLTSLHPATHMHVPSSASHYPTISILHVQLNNDFGYIANYQFSINKSICLFREFNNCFDRFVFNNEDNCIILESKQCFNYNFLND